MKKTLLTLVVAAFAFTVSAQESTSVDGNLEINTAKLAPIEYSSQEELNEMAVPRIAVLKAELAKEGLSDEGKTSLTELLWRFENAVIVEENK